MSFFLNKKPAILVLEDGLSFEGFSVGVQGFTVGEIVFNTSLSGYQEMLTDPSYARQIITLTTAHVGNTGCNLEDYESQKIFASGLVIRNCTDLPSNYRSNISLPLWLEKNNVIAIAGIDTRELTLHLREKGAMGACIHTNADAFDEALNYAKGFTGLQDIDLANEVSLKTVSKWQKGNGSWIRELQKDHKAEKKLKIVVYDFGVKHSILRIFNDLGCDLTLVPAKTPAHKILALNPDGVFFSNGPGDPEVCGYAIDAVKEVLKSKIPIFGICLGFQLLALACGAKSLKMKFGHHGANHPVIDIENNKIFITSQNHGFAIDEESLPENLKATHRSLFDNSLQGIKHKFLPAFGFQGHPEASPGPHDIELIFNQFIKACQERALLTTV